MAFLVCLLFRESIGVAITNIANILTTVLVFVGEYITVY